MTKPAGRLWELLVARFGACAVNGVAYQRVHRLGCAASVGVGPVEAGPGPPYLVQATVERASAGIAIPMRRSGRR